MIVTTPNRSFNAHIVGMRPNTFRHDDHVFEWDESEFSTWYHGQCALYPQYQCTGYGIGYLTHLKIPCTQAVHFQDSLHTDMPSESESAYTACSTRVVCQILNATDHLAARDTCIEQLMSFAVAQGKSSDRVSIEQAWLCIPQIHTFCLHDREQLVRLIMNSSTLGITLNEQFYYII